MATLETVRVQLTPQDAVKVMKGHDDRGEPWGLNCTRIDGTYANMTLNVDGSDTEVEICMRANGTWTASTRLVLGEKK